MNSSDARARRYALQTVKPSPARLVAPEPDAWLPIFDVTAELEAIDITGELELLALEEGRVDLERELETLEADFWRSAEADHPFLTGGLPAATTDTASLSIFEAAPPVETPERPPELVDLPTEVPTVVAAALPSDQLTEIRSEPAPEHQPIIAGVLEAESVSAPLLVPAEYARVQPDRPAIVGRRRSLRLRRRVIVTALVVALTAAFVGVTAQVLGSTQPRRDVTVSIDGQASTIVTREGTVADVLTARGIVLNRGDRVIPSLATKLHQGMPISVIRSFPLVVDVDGVVTARRPTRHRLSALRRELGLPVGLVALGSPGRLGRGDRLVLRTPHDVSLIVDGVTSPLSRVTALTAGELVASRNIVMGPQDEMQPVAETRIVSGMTVRVFRIAADEVAEEQLTPFPTEYRDNASLAAGHTQTIQAGQNGRVRVVSKVVRRDGQVVEWTEVRREVVAAPVTRILARGTKTSGNQTPPANPVTGGRYWGSGSATFYDSHAGAGACAHLTLPFGTILRLVNKANGKTAQCRVGDRGPEAWTGHVIDLNPDVFAALAPLSTGVIRLDIYIR